MKLLSRHCDRHSDHAQMFIEQSQKRELKETPSPLWNTPNQRALDWFQRSIHWQNNRSDKTNSPWEPALSPSQGSRTGNPIVHRVSAFSFFYCPLPFPHTFLTFYLHLFKVKTAPDTKTSHPPQQNSSFKHEFQHSFNNRLCPEPQFLNEGKKTILAS